MAARTNDPRRVTSSALLATSALTLLVITSPTTGLGQEQTPTTTVRMPTMTVTATGNPLAAFDYPGLVSVIDRQRIEEVQPLNVEEIFRETPGISFNNGPRRTGQVPSIRGFDGPDVVVLFDGVRQNFNSGHDGRFFIDPFLIGGAEVVKGPTSALYGSGGLGGTIEFRTLDASDILRPGETSGVVGRPGYATAKGEDSYGLIGTTRAGAAEAVAALTYRDAGDIELGNGDTERNNEQLTSGLIKGSYAFADGQDVEVSYLGFRNDATEPNNGQGQGSGGLVDKDVRNDTFRLAYGVNPAANDLLDVKAVLGLSRNEVDETTLDDGGASPPDTDLERDLDSVNLRLSNVSRFDFGDGIDTAVTFGVEGFGDKQDGSSSATDDGERGGVPDATAYTLAGFLQAEIGIDTGMGRVLVVPGVRFDHFDNDADGQDAVNESEVSPKLGVSYLPTEWLMLFGSYAHGFRAPTFDELYADGTHFTIGPIINSFVANPDLEPQTTDTFEIGAGVQFDGIVTPDDFVEIKGSYYYTDAEDFIDLVVDQPEVVGGCFAPPPFGIDCNGTSRSENVANATLEGVEIEGLYDQKYTALRLGFTHIDGEDDDTGDPLGSLEPDTLTAALTLKAPEFDTFLTWRSTFAGRLDRAPQGQELSSYTLHDTFLTYAPLAGPLSGLRLDLGVTNIFDEAYERTNPGDFEEGRSYRAGFSYTVAW